MSTKADMELAQEAFGKVAPDVAPFLAEAMLQEPQDAEEVLQAFADIMFTQEEPAVKFLIAAGCVNVASPF